MRQLLVANRGEIAVRIMHAAAELGVRTVAVYAEDDAGALHVRRADAAVPLRGSGPRAYLDGAQLVRAARDSGCDAVHPGYGFLSEQADFARAVAAAGLTFVGPAPETLELFGDKTRARALAAACGVPVLRGSDGPVGVAEAEAFRTALGPGAAVVLKAVAGGGGRGVRVVAPGDDLAAAFARAQSEAARAAGSGALYVEEHMPRARHIEVQVVGDGRGTVVALGERECSIQRRHQKLVELAPCPALDPALRARLVADATRMAAAATYRNAGTFEFLVDADAAATAGPGVADDPVPRLPDGRPLYAFIEANPRLQVEHTVTEEVFGVDLVRVQLLLAAGRSLDEAGLPPGAPPQPRGHAIQVRINAETLGPDGTARPATGTVTAFELPGGHGVRVDTCAHAGYRPGPDYDPLLAKLVGHSTSPRFADAVTRTHRALGEFVIEGLPTNIGFLRRLLQHPDFVANRIHTRFLDEHLAALAGDAGATAAAGAAGAAGLVASAPHGSAPPGGTVVLEAPLQGTVVSVAVRAGDTVRQGDELCVLTAMKMEHVVHAPAAGRVVHVGVAAGDTVPAGHPLLTLEAGGEAAAAGAAAGGPGADLDAVRPDLAEVLERHALTLDAARPEAVARRRAAGQRTARENIADLCDPGSFVEYGGLAIAAQRQRRPLEELVRRTPADGLVAGIGTVNAALFGGHRARCAVLAYDYTVLAGTQGWVNHRKKDRLFELAARLRIPVVVFTEGGGGRPGDTDAPAVASLDCMAFRLFAGLSGLVPLVAVNSGRCFAGNAALLGCCDVVIATANSTIGMGGPAMIEGGGLGVYRPEEVGPMRVQVPNGVVDIPVADDAEAVRVARQYLSYFQGSVAEWTCADQRLLRALVPENRLRVYDVRAVIATLADTGSVLELRRQFAPGMITALVRLEGQPFGVIANNPAHLGGAIDSAGADKAARFMQLCDAFDLPLLFLCDTPGIMVGPEAEATATVRHTSRMFVVGASLTVPVFTIVLRKAYGLGAQAMAAGSHKAPVGTVAWPTGEFGGMGLEGAVRLGFRRELEAVADPVARQQLFEHMVARAYEHGKALNTASHFEIDDVIDPAASRQWVLRLWRAAPPPPRRRRRKRPCVDTW